MAAFTASVDRIIGAYKDRLEAVFRGSAQDVIADAQTPVARGGRMPVDTGFLRNSLVSQLLGGSAIGGGDGYSAVIAGARIGGVVDFTWTAGYARPVEYGARGQPGRAYVRGALAQWQAIVDRNVERAKQQIRP